MKRHLSSTATILLALALGTTSPAQPIAQSTFDSDTEGWMVISTGTPPHYGPPNWSNTGGPDGGFIYDTDMDNGGWGFLAPDSFTGPIPHAYGGSLSFQFFADKIGPDHDAINVAFSRADGTGIVHRVTPPTPAGQVADRQVFIDESHGWYNFDYLTGTVGTPADAPDIQYVLSDVEYLFLGAELWPGFDDPSANPPVVGELVAYDNIVLTPEPATIILLVCGVLALVYRRTA